MCKGEFYHTEFVQPAQHVMRQIILLLRRIYIPKMVLTTTFILFDWYVYFTYSA